MSTIDHAAEARVLAKTADGIPFQHEEPEAPRLLASAQVHATLALTDEQHTANLIAYLAYQNGQMQYVERSGEMVPDDQLARARALRHRIQQRLGLIP